MGITRADGLCSPEGRGMMSVRSDVSGRVIAHLEAALEHVEDPEARYHIRESLQILQERTD